MKEQEEQLKDKMCFPKVNFFFLKKNIKINFLKKSNDTATEVL